MNQLISWLQERFFCSKPKLLFQNLSRFLDGEMKESVCSTLSNNGTVYFTIKGKLGDLIYERVRIKTGARIVIEEIEFVSRVRSEKSFSFKLADNELSVLQYNGSNPCYSPRITIMEQQELTAFMDALRQKSLRLSV